eukprot:795844_1
MDHGSRIQHQTQKLIIILGTTAVGKTKLSVELAKELSKCINTTTCTNIMEHKAEIISADSVQVYKGMEICSDAITPEEAQGVPHHLVGFLSPHESYSVQDFVSCASTVIDDIDKRNKIPIIAGGTLYYSEALLFKTFCSESAIQSKTNKNESNDVQQHVQNKLNALSDDELWNKLHAVDPVMANFYHKNNHRRIRRSLEVFYETGQCHSEWIKKFGGKWNDLRYDPLIIWLDADINVIDQRINTRLTTMGDKGIFEEIEKLYHYCVDNYGYDALGNEDDKSKTNTPYISILHGFGFQAFLPWLRAKYKEKIEDKESLKKIRKECIDKYGMDTRRYARKQRRWLKNRISRPALLLPIYRLDTSDKEQWKECVLDVVVKIVQCFLNDKEIDEDIVKRLDSVNKLGDIKEMKRSVNVESLTDWKNYECDTCNQVLHGEMEWKTHLKSKKHKKRLRNLKRQRENNLLRFENYMNYDWHQINSF